MTGRMIDMCETVSPQANPLDTAEKLLNLVMTDAQKCLQFSSATGTGVLKRMDQDRMIRVAEAFIQLSQAKSQKDIADELAKLNSRETVLPE